MIATTLHLLTCIALAVVSLYWRSHALDGDSIYRHVMPFIVAAGFLGLLILYGYFVEFFVAYYSGAIYKVGRLTGGQMAWIAISVILSLLPLAGLIPRIGRQSLLLIAVACLAAVPSVVSLISHTSNRQAEKAAP